MTCDHPNATELSSGVDSAGVGKLTEWIEYRCQDCGEIFHETHQVASR